MRRSATPIPYDRYPAVRDMVGGTTPPRITDAACRGRSPDLFHPDDGDPDDAVTALCALCPSRLPCLALALRTEDPEARSGWYGGLGPAERGALADRLGCKAPSPPDELPGDAATALRLRRAGASNATIASALGRSRRTVQRLLRAAERWAAEHEERGGRP
ncbi:WhiB family transcriptional regulator [Streptomyces sp. NPDC054796]